jgi:SAM-dependent methyltransferase
MAARLLESVRTTIPLGIEQIDIILRLIAAARHPVEAFLDLGSGDPLLAGALLDEYPDSRGVFVAPSAAALAPARNHLRPHAPRLAFLEADIREAGWSADVVQHGPLDVVISAFALAHLSHDEKQSVFRETFPLLKPEGLFIVVEHVASATRWTESVWNDYVIDAIFGKQLENAGGRTRAELAREYFVRSAGSVPVPPPLEVQCDWLRAVGYENVDCYLKVLELAVFGGQKPAA